MKAADFLSVADDLLADAMLHGAAIEDQGFRVSIEPYNIEYPRLPCFLARRQHTSVIVEVQGKIDLAIVREWVRYGKGCQSDTRVLLCLSRNVAVTAKHIEELKTVGAGLTLIGNDGPYEVLPATDLALNLELPELPRGLKRLLGGAYSQFNRGQWREGFEDACQVFEQEARNYLKTGQARGRISIVTATGKKFGDSQISKMPMGNLRDLFGMIQIPNSADTRITQALERLNPDRITVAHYKGVDKRKENRLRKNVARDMFVLVGGLRQIRGISN